MTTRYLKIDNEWVMGKNKKKLRYIINKNNLTIMLKFPANWSENDFDDLNDLYPKYSIIEDSTKKRGRPVKKINRKDDNRCKIKSAAIYDTDDEIEYDIGDRVKCMNNYQLGIGDIVEIIGKTVKIRFIDNKIKIVNVENIKKARGRKVKKKIDNKNDLTIGEDNYTLELLKYDGNLYLINNLNEVATMDGDYIGVFYNGKII